MACIWLDIEHGMLHMMILTVCQSHQHSWWTISALRLMLSRLEGRAEGFLSHPLVPRPFRHSLRRGPLGMAFRLTLWSWGRGGVRGGRSTIYLFSC